MKDILELQYQQYVSESQDDVAFAEKIVASLPRRESVLLRLLRWLGSDMVVVTAMWVLVGAACAWLVSCLQHDVSMLKLVVFMPLMLTGIAFATHETARV